MNLNDYQKQANCTLRPDPIMDMLIHAGMGMATESGEFLDTIKKTKFYGKKLDHDNLVEEAGDLLWYIAAAAQALGVSLEEIAERNISKLRARYPAGFTEYDATNRDLDAEALAMHGGVGPC